MKINMIQCDICGKMVDHNDKKIGYMLSDRAFSHDNLCIDRGFYEQFKDNQLMLRGITNRKNIQESINKKDGYENIIINMKFDLCENCLIELYKMINEYIKEMTE